MRAGLELDTGLLKLQISIGIFLASIMKGTSDTAKQQALLLGILEQGYSKTAWHGPNLKAAIRRVHATQAVWRPKAGRRNIAEIVVHCAYWKYAIRRRVRGDKRGSFPLKGSNWFKIPARLSEKTWHEYVTLLDEEHRALHRAIATASWVQMVNSFDKSEKKATSHIYGVAFHDVYHAGQIQTLKAMFKKATRK